jgi:hypothetical protein
VGSGTLCPQVGFGRYAKVEVSCVMIAGSWEDEGTSQCNSLIKEFRTYLG